MRGLWVALWIGLALPACADETPTACNDIVYEQANYTVCQFDSKTHTMRLFLNDESGTPYGNFTKLDGVLKDAGTPLLFAMNAGMYHQDRSAVGLYIEDGREVQKLNTNEGPGNFHLLPNGVFALNADGAHVMQSARYALTNMPVDYATQSGPMLVIEGALHPKFKKSSDSVNIRNGVGVSGDTVFFVISNDRVNFHAFASLFKDHLETPNALFLDGAVSKIYAPELKRNDYGAPMGPIIAVITNSE